MSKNTELDRFDLAILQTLQENGRITKVALAEAVHLSPSPCLERLKRLEKAGYITAYRARVDLRRITSVTEIFVEVTLASHQAADFRQFEAAIMEVPEIVECAATGGGIDYMLKLVVHDIDAYQRLMDRLLEAGIGIDRYFGYVVTKPIKSRAPDLSRLIGRE